MNRYVFLAALLAMAPPAGAQTPPAGTLFAALGGDWNGDGVSDLALLVSDDPQSSDGADLILYLGDGYALVETLRVPGVVYAGTLFGQAPGLEARTDTSFMIRAEQTAIGRSPWNSAVTVAWRGGSFVVAGYTYTTYDRIENTGGRCDVNLLTGGWEVTFMPADDGPDRVETGRDGPRAFPLSDLDQDFLPPVCTRIFD
jgi:hypothetical protein